MELVTSTVFAVAGSKSMSRPSLFVPPAPIILITPAADLESSTRFPPAVPRTSATALFIRISPAKFEGATPV